MNRHGPFSGGFFDGLGAGLHLKTLIQQYTTQYLILHVDRPIDLYISCHFTEWRYILDYFSENPNREFKLIVSDNGQPTTMIWNHLVNWFPFFPANANIINYHSTPNNTSIAKFLTAEVKKHLISWGFWDDELNQINNALHNAKQASILTTHAA